jgi:dienelactone hydrolase
MGAALFFVTASIVVLAWHASTGATSNVDNTNTDATLISIPTPDGLTLTASLTRPTTAGTEPAIILLHEYAQDHHQWDPYIGLLNGAGFVVVSLDLRGFGESRLPVIPASLDDVFASLPKDVTAAVDYLQAQPGVDHQHITVLGASLGANTAYVASGLEPRVTKTALVSPIASPAVLTGYGAKNFQPRNVAGWMAADDAATLTAFITPVQGSHEQHTVPNGGRGISLLQTSGVLDSIVAWLKS